MNVRFLVLTSSIVILSACSLLLDRRADQCSTDGDCSKFAGTRCDQKVRLCLVPDGPDGGNPSMNDSGAKPDAGLDATAPNDVGDVAIEAFVDPCLGPTGCYACAPANDRQFGNGCSDAACKPFDNDARLKNLLPDGGLTPLPPREAGAL